MDKPLKRSIFAASLGFTLLTAGCAATRPPAGGTGAPAVSQEHYDETARKMLHAFINDNARIFVETLPDEMRSQFGIKEFAAARAELTETLGTPLSFRFDTTLEHPVFNVSIWKVRFERRDSETGAAVHQEVLFQVISGTLDGEVRVISFKFS